MNTKKIFAVIALVGLVGIMPVAASAATLRGGDSFSVPRDTTISGDFYAAGGNGSIAGNIDGDLMVAGGSLVVSGNIEQDAFLAGGSITISGDIKDDLRVVGGNITITGSIDGDLVVAGGQVQVISGAFVGGDVVVAGGTVMMDGSVEGNIKAVGGKVSIDGTVSGSVFAKVEQLTIGSSAVIGDGLSYQSRKEAVISDSADIQGGIDYKPLKGPNRENVTRGIIAALAVVKTATFLMFLAAALVLGLLWKKFTNDGASRLGNNFWGSLGWGLIMVIVTPVVGIALAITIIGIPLAILLFLAYGLGLLIACILAPVVLGAWLIKWITKSATPKVDWVAILLGVVVFNLVGIIPVLGGLFKIILLLSVVGSLTVAWRKLIWDNR